MKLVLMSGGSGKRLFPLSNDVRSKQFLRVLPSKDGERISMLQRVWTQIGDVGLVDHTWICASKVHCEIIQNQLGAVQLIQEPRARDTFPAIAYSTSYLADVAGASDDEVVVFMPVDPYVDDSFFHKVKDLEEVVKSSGADIALLGVKPGFPSTRFGYIVPVQSNRAANWLDVNRFEEKPSLEKAEALVGEGALWNCGVFAFRVGFLRNFLQSNGYPWKYFKITESFQEMPKISFDYAVVEKANRVVALQYDGLWEDIGTWDVLSQHVKDDIIGHGRVVHSENTHAINELHIPVVVAGVTDLMVVSSPDGILVAHKDIVADMKRFIEGIGQRPMYEERRWGTYKVLDYSISDEQQVLVKNVCIKAGRHLSYQMHRQRTEVWTVVSGVGVFASETGIRTIQAGDVITITPGMWHGVKAESDLQFIEVQTGAVLSEEDIMRKFEDWTDMKNYLTEKLGL